MHRHGERGLHAIGNHLHQVGTLYLLLAISGALHAQEIAIYSEFERFNPFGEAVAQDRDPRPREILSPAVPRNGHLSVHVVVTAPAGTNYFLYAGSSPPDIVHVKIYREHFVRCGTDYCPDWLTEQESPTFGAMPESFHDMPDQNTRCYLFDIWVPPDVTPRRVRVEALLKTAIWAVAPMELRVIDATVPSSEGVEVREDIAPVEAQSSETARIQMLRFLCGLAPEMPDGILRVGDVVQRNAAEDMLLARAAHLSGPALNLPGWPTWGFLRPGAEWYLPVRDLIRAGTHWSQ
jgi:hypothetical protein